MAICQGFRFDQELIFSYKSRVVIDDSHSGYWLIIMPGRVVRVCAAILVVSYAEKRLWYVAVDIIAFARDLGTAMTAMFGSRANMHEIFEMLEVIEATRFDFLPTGWRNRTNGGMDHHLGRCDEGGDFIYYYPFARQIVDEGTAKSLLSAIRVIPDNAPTGWEHDENDVEWAPHDTIRDYRPGISMYPPLSPIPHTHPASTPFRGMEGGGGDVDFQPVGPPVGGADPSGLVDGYTIDEMVAIRRFLTDAGVLSAHDGVTTISEMRWFVRGHMG